MRLLTLTIALVLTVPLAHAQSYDGTLAPGDETLSSGEYADAYAVDVADGQRLVVDLRAADFDPYLIVTSPSDEQIDNDDWQDNRDWSRVEVEDAEGGTWSVIVTSYDVGETGSYTLTLDTAASGANPLGLPDLPTQDHFGDLGGSTEGRTWSFEGRITDGDAVVPLTAGHDPRHADRYEVQLQQGDRLTVEMTSNDFDTYLRIERGGERVAFNDDAGSTSRSYVDHTAAQSGTHVIYAGTFREAGRGAYAVRYGVGTDVAAEASNTPDPRRPVAVCYLDGADLTEGDALYDPSTGDTTMDGRLFSTAGYEYSDWVYERGRYAAQTPWYINNEPISIGGGSYVKFGLPRVLGVNEVVFLAEADGAAVFAEPGVGGAPEIVYVAVRPGCEFQPYQREIE